MKDLSRSKRVFDVAVSAVALVCLTPLMLLVGLAVRLDVGTPVLFRQARPGLGGHPFTIYKFRTMRSDAGRSDAERLTRVGRFLRATSIDELPELWNVIRGDMSLVGPRPLLMEYLPLYTPRQARRHEVRPGLTGWAQVNGRNTLAWDDRFDADVWYVDNWSFMLDLMILYRTMARVLRREGVSQAGQATVERFRGSHR